MNCLLEVNLTIKSSNRVSQGSQASCMETIWESKRSPHAILFPGNLELEGDVICMRSHAYHFGFARSKAKEFNWHDSRIY